MKKYFLIFVLIITTLFLISCSPAHSNLPPSSNSPSLSQTSVPTQTPNEIKEATKEPITPPSIQPEPTKQTTTEPTSTTPLTSTLSPEKIKSPPLAPQIRTTPAVLPPPLSITAFDQFTGSTIDSTKYNTQLTGNSTIIQNDKLIIQGNSDKGISWASLYTTKIYTTQNDYNLSVDVNLAGSVTEGSAHAVLGLETLPILTTGKNPERNYCELRLSRNDKILRMSKTINHLDQNTPLSGTINLYFNKNIGKLTCTFNGQTITQYQEPQTGEYYGSLRSGLNYVSEGGGIETSGTGDYTATFDNFFIKQN